jgi:hypothetical protein
VSDLAARLALPQPRVSGQLARLRTCGLVETIASGRQRICHVEAVRVAPLLAALGSTPGAARPRPRGVAASRLVRDDAPLRQARRCYDHLAGVAGVALCDEFQQRGWLAFETRTSAFQLTADGAAALGRLGVDVATARRARRRFAGACLDWTERRPHLGGALGAAVLATVRRAGLIRLGAGRTLMLEQPLAAWLTGAG